MAQYFDDTSWDDGWENTRAQLPAPQITNGAQMTVQHFHLPPPPPPRPQIVYAAARPSPPTPDDLGVAIVIFFFGALVFAFVTNFSPVYFLLLGIFVGGVALVWGFCLFVSWAERFSNSHR
jgi:hypothetical protein